MKKCAILIPFLLSSLFSCVQTNENVATTYYFLRHAEKEIDGTKNPHLSKEGVERAHRWAKVLEAEKLDVIYSTDYYRTLETARPVVDTKKLKVIKYDPSAFDFEDFKTKTNGQKVLVVGHSNTTPQFVNSLIGEDKYEQIHEDTYSHMYIVTVYGDEISDVLLKIE